MNLSAIVRTLSLLCLVLSCHLGSAQSGSPYWEDEIRYRYSIILKLIQTDQLYLAEHQSSETLALALKHLDPAHPLTGNIYFQHAAILNEMGIHEAALDQIRAALSIRQQHQAPQDDLVLQCYRVLGDIRTNLADWEEGLSAYSRALGGYFQMDPFPARQVASLYIQFADLYARQRRTEVAIRYLGLALQIYRTHPVSQRAIEAHAKMGSLQVKVQNWEEARSHTDSALSMVSLFQPPQPILEGELRLQMGQIEQGLGHFPEAKEYFVSALDLFPQHRLVLQGKAYLALGTLAEAEAEWNRAWLYHRSLLDLVDHHLATESYTLEVPAPEFLELKFLALAHLTSVAQARYGTTGVDKWLDRSREMALAADRWNMEVRELQYFEPDWILDQRALLEHYQETAGFWADQYHAGGSPKALQMLVNQIQRIGLFKHERDLFHARRDLLGVLDSEWLEVERRWAFKCHVLGNRMAYVTPSSLPVLLDSLALVQRQYAGMLDSARRLSPEYFAWSEPGQLGEELPPATAGVALVRGDSANWYALVLGQNRQELVHLADWQGTGPMNMGLIQGDSAWNRVWRQLAPLDSLLEGLDRIILVHDAQWEQFPFEAIWSVGPHSDLDVHRFHPLISPDPASIGSEGTDWYGLFDGSRNVASQLGASGNPGSVREYLPEWLDDEPYANAFHILGRDSLAGFMEKISEVARIHISVSAPSEQRLEMWAPSIAQRQLQAQVVCLAPQSMPSPGHVGMGRLVKAFLQAGCPYVVRAVQPVPEQYWVQFYEQLDAGMSVPQAFRAMVREGRNAGGTGWQWLRLEVAR
ncbi:tetratricopeptide repeat protein [Pontibacter sp. G13]|uniref:tetratricopeptide repeat protein n=1 Tax=Pontibacter sp. G13 TaxID=3074898 RepID=UPI00288A6EE1|nr:tetratricopeptide repeat protein [Pontibacter sp. G13]WNJ21588.1 tetratricopeptide repeat protein [Pontibacter sp. G13]